MKNSIENYENLYEYMKSVSLREPEILNRHRKETVESLPKSFRMQIAPDQGQFMALIVKLIGAKNILEIGTFTGYSALVLAMALPPEGKILTCDINDEWTRIAHKYWKEAGVDENIDLIIGPAADTLDAQLEKGGSGSFDLIFIDADKESYDEYYERGLKLLRQNGLIIIDNVFWNGRVIDPEVDVDDLETKSIKALNQKIHTDNRVDISMLSVGDGIFLIRKR